MTKKNLNKQIKSLRILIGASMTDLQLAWKYINKLDRSLTDKKTRLGKK